jgi:uncharacterized FAD-dependent dehydrogenase
MTPRRIELKIPPAQAADPGEVRRLSLAAAGWAETEGISLVPVRRSIDARKGEPKVVLLIDLYPGPPPPCQPEIMSRAPERKRGRVIVVGAGPAGYFCALELLLLGLRPIVLERGKDTRARRYDLRAIMQHDTVNPDSNYCFGEGGAGTYSDGKLYTRSGKSADIQRVLRMLVEHGAKQSILVDTHPHIGSNKLPYVVEALRASIERHGGEVHFGQHVSDLVMVEGRLRGVVSAGGDRVEGDAVVLATGHSARDIFQLLSRKGLAMEAKTYALGLRVEHPQPLIDEIQYRQRPRDPHLPPASYRLAADDVYSFCMCPGGLIVPAATAPGEIVVNGMSMSRRDSRWANSGIVTTVTRQDLAPYLEQHGALAGLALQSDIERAAFALSGSQKAPAQLLGDFLQDRVSPELPRTSYVPGVVSADLRRLLPRRIGEALAHGFRHFAGSLKGFLHEQAVVVGVESRTSSPLRIPRRAETLAHPQLDNFYPCGEGAGYAGGIVSAALDGQRVARAVARALCGRDSSVRS